MPLPANWTTVTVTHTYQSLAGAPMRGSVTFTSSVRVSDRSAGVTVPPSSHRVNLDETGTISVALPVVDDPDTEPTGWHYVVSEDLTDPTGQRRSASYQVQVTAAMAPTVDLADLVAVAGVSEVTPYARLSVDNIFTGNQTFRRPLLMESTADGGLDTSDSTSRVTVQSWQTAGNNFFGEGIRLDLMRAMSKNMIAWRLPDPPSSSDPAALKTVVWAGAHYYAQDQPDPQNPTDVHGHWSIEVPDALRRLRTRLEIKFVDAAGTLGLDKTLVQTSSADLVVDCSNGQVLRLRTGAGAAKYVEWGNDQWGAATRWRLGVPTGLESGGNAGSDFVVERFNDAGSPTGTPLAITRSSGRVLFGGSDGSQSGVDINRNAAGNALFVNTNFAGATGATGYAYTAVDATSRGVALKIAAEPNFRLVVFSDGRHEWGDGTNTRDTNLYRSVADTLKTDDALHVGATLRHLGTQLGFYNATAVSKQTVSGSRGGNAALASLLTALAALGLVTDGTSA